MAEDLRRLSKLGPDRVVESVAAAKNLAPPHYGLLVKFGMRTGTTETLAFFGKPGDLLHDAFKQASAAKQLPRISDAESDRLVAAAPKIEHYDWNLQNEQSRAVVNIKAISFSNAMAFEFDMGAGPPRQFALPLNVARFLAEWVHQYFQDDGAK